MRLPLRIPPDATPRCLYIADAVCCAGSKGLQRIGEEIKDADAGERSDHEQRRVDC